MKRVAFVVGALIALGASVAHAADDPTRAPTTTTSADHRSSSDGRRTLTVSQATDLKADVQSVTVEGAGYDNTKGIYVAFCVIPPNPQTAPGPCGGGQDRTGQGGGAVWVSSNPPVYARGLTTPYGKGGTFKVSINVQAQLNEETDCRVVRCAVTTRNDHTRSSDRSQDILVPTYFQGGFAPPKPGAPVTTVTTTAASRRPGAATTTTLIESLAAPLATVSDDRLAVSAGGKTLRASATDGLTSGGKVDVTGTGYDSRKGIYVSLCFINAQNAPGPCASGSAGQSAWISSNPPDYGKNLATAYKDGGSFDVSLTLDPVIDAEHDCTKVACAIATRNDDTHPGDHSQDLMLPVSFAAQKPATPVRIATPVDDDSSNAGPLAAGVVVLLAAIGGTAFMFMRRRSALV